ncbi:MAG TPA: hypothetical protein VF796_21205 [Humisphaera sp.]
MIYPSTRSDPSPYDEGWSRTPAQRPVYLWGLGLVVPLVLITYGAWVVVSGETAIGRGGSVRLVGTAAVAFGVAVAAAGLLLHFRYFWGTLRDDTWWFGALGRIVSLVALIGALGVMIVSYASVGLR